MAQPGNNPTAGKAIVQTDIKGVFKQFFKSQAHCIAATDIYYYTLRHAIERKKPINGNLYRFATEKDLLEYDRVMQQINNAKEIKDQKVLDENKEIKILEDIPAEKIIASKPTGIPEPLNLDVIEEAESSSFENLLKKVQENFGNSSDLL